MPSNEGTNTYRRVTHMAFASEVSGVPCEYRWDDINSAQDAEVEAAEALAQFWRTCTMADIGYGPDANFRSTVEYLEQHGYTDIAAAMRRGE